MQPTTDSRKRIISNADPMQGAELAVFAQLYRKACDLEIFTPTPNGAVLFKAMLCGLKPGESDTDTNGQTLKVNIAAMLIIYLLFLKEQAAPRGLTMEKQYNSYAKQWTDADPDQYDHARRGMQGFKNVHKGTLQRIAPAFYDLAHDTLNAVQGKHPKATKRR